MYDLIKKNKPTSEAEQKDALSIAERVFAQESEGIQALSDAVKEHFSQAVELILKSHGRVIVTGMGKSGHIARKMAATFASTGTPAMFVHPGEASHGDLGMITKNDVVIALSNSGETAELKDIIQYTRRFSIPLIGIVRRKQSVLAEAADIPFVLPAIPEACNIKAPTTSTTMMLVLGDALAVALLETRDFTTDDFSIFHPGGKIGASFTKIADVMHTGDEIPLVPASLKMSDVLLVMTSKRFGCVAVLDDDQKLAGVITDGDLRRHMSDTFLDKVAADVMTPSPVTIGSSALVGEALNVMNTKAITALFVLKEDRAVEGIIHIHDCLRVGAA